MPDVYGIGSIAGAGISAIGNIFGSWLGNKYAAERESTARKENFQYNEQAAQNADSRTRALYNDLYSPQAQLQQLKAAGLSPSLFYGDGGGISGQAGAQGAGAGGISPNVFGAPNFDFAQLAKTIAETNLIKAETKKTDSETNAVDLENDIKTIDNNIYKEVAKLNATFIDTFDKEGNKIGSHSLYEEASNALSYNEFQESVLNAFKRSDNPDAEIFCKTEFGQKALRDIYYAANKLDRDIRVLSNEGIDADFQKSIVNALKNINYENKNAEAVAADLEKQIEASKLDAEQRKSWNNIIERMRKKNSEASDWVIVLAMILDRFVTNSVHLGASNSTTTTIKK